jgi:hypothetical protein
MISARQLKRILDKVFTSDTIVTYAVPSALLTATPNSYLRTNPPINIGLGSTIVPYSNTITAWEIYDETNALVTAGSGLTVAAVDSTVPTNPGSYSYRLVVRYNDPDGNVATPIEVSTTITVESESYVGALADPSADITAANQVDNALIQTLTSKTKNQVINYFTVTVTPASARIIFVIPNSYGSVIRIEDNLENDLLDDGQIVSYTDSVNGRTIYKTVNALTSGTYTFKLIY